MKEFTDYEEVYGKQILTNGNTEWFGTVTGKHTYSPKEVDFNIQKTDKNDFKVRDCPFSPFDEYCTGHCVNCENRLECIDCSKRLKSEAYKEIIAKLKENLCSYDLPDYHYFRAVDEDVIDEVLEEMVGK